MRHHDPKQVSELYLIFQRTVTFFDEWLFYGLLLYLFVNSYWLMFALVVLVGVPIIWNSYRRQWAMEEARFGPLIETDMFLHEDERDQEL